MTTKKDFAKAKRKQFVSRLLQGLWCHCHWGFTIWENTDESREAGHLYQWQTRATQRNQARSDSDYTVKEAERSIKGLEHQLEELQNWSEIPLLNLKTLALIFFCGWGSSLQEYPSNPLDLGMSRGSPIPLQKKERHGDEGETGSGRAWR